MAFGAQAESMASATMPCENGLNVKAFKAARKNNKGSVAGEMMFLKKSHTGQKKGLTDFGQPLVFVWLPSTDSNRGHGG